jgi:uncharacterized membrane protein YesL
MIFSALKKAGLDIWDEIFLLGLFNILWVLGTMPGLWLIGLGLGGELFLFIPLGILLLLPWPFVTFSLFYIVRDVGEGKSIHFSDFFNYGRQTWRAAYLWGGVNIAVIFIVWVNLQFYAAVGAQWAIFMQLLMGALTIVWLVLQLVALPLYPRLQQPSLKLALRNAMIITGRHIIAILVLVVIVVILAAISLYFPPLLFFLAIATIAVVANRIVEEAVKVELEREPS